MSSRYTFLLLLSIHSLNQNANMTVSQYDFSLSSHFCVHICQQISLTVADYMQKLHLLIHVVEQESNYMHMACFKS